MELRRAALAMLGCGFLFVVLSNNFSSSTMPYGNSGTMFTAKESAMTLVADRWISYTNPRKMHHMGNDSVLFGVLSNSATRRAAIRKAWGANQSLIFVIGDDPASGDGEDDVLWVDIVETYNAGGMWSSLTVKSMVLMQYAASIKADYVFKTDDDCYVDTHRLKTILRHYRPEYWGNSEHSRKPVNRNNIFTRYQNAMALTNYPKPWLPAFATGGGYALSQGMIDCVARQSTNMMIIPNEDVAVGLLVEKCNGTLQHYPIYKDVVMHGVVR